MSRQYVVDKNTMTGIADAIRNTMQEKGPLTTAQMISKIQNTRVGMPVDLKVHYNSSGHWIRPEGYPNLEALYSTIGDTESCVYLTYDLTKTPGYGWIGVYAAGATWYVDRGHITNNTFIADWTSSAQSSGAYFRQALDSANGNVQLWRVRSSGNLYRFCYIPNTGTNANNYSNNVQPCVERAGKLPYATNLSSSISTSSTSGCFGTVWLEKDTFMPGTKANVTTLASMYYNCYLLEETNCNEWNTSGWVVTAASSMFYSCMRLKNLNLSGWDVSKWTISGNNFRYVWNNCYSLETLNVSTWDVSGWRPTSLESVWSMCLSLKELDLSNWNVSSWDVSSLSTTWYYCVSARKIDISTWVTTNWHVTSLSSTWAYCCSMEKGTMENWNTTNWAVTHFGSTFYMCNSLKSLDLSGWVVTNWTVTTFSYAFGQCRSLRSLNISNWNTTNWAVTTLLYTWGADYSLESLDLSGWTTTNWAVTTVQQCWDSCFSLRELKIGNWNVSNWVVTTFNYVFNCCYSLETIDLSSWNVSNWAVTTVYYLFNCTYGAKTINIGNWNVSNWALTETRNLYGSTGAETLLLPAGLCGTVANAKYTSNVYCLINFAQPSIDIAQNYSNSLRLTHDSLVTMISRLPTIDSSKTLTLGQNNKNKLTAAEIAVATGKGWTVA